MRQREAEAKKAGRPFAARREWVAFESIPALLKKAVLVSEDAAFYEHKGIDFAELKVAIKQGMKEKRIVRGASTITQQLAKNLFLSTDRTLWRKLKEVWLAKRLEKALPKNRIFALYLNLIEFGPGVFGVQAASRHWFGKDAADLTLEEVRPAHGDHPPPAPLGPADERRLDEIQGKVDRRHIEGGRRDLPGRALRPRPLFRIISVPFGASHLNTPIILRSGRRSLPEN